MRVRESKRLYKKRQQERMAAVESTYHAVQEEIAALRKSTATLELCGNGLVQCHDYACSLLDVIASVQAHASTPLLRSPSLGLTAESIVMAYSNNVWEHCQEFPPSIYTIWDSLSLESLGRIEAVDTTRLIECYAEYKTCYSSRKRLAPKLEASLNTRRRLGEYFCQKPPALILDYAMAAVIDPSIPERKDACQRIMEVLRSFTFTSEQQEAIARAWDRYTTLLALVDDDIRSVQRGIGAAAEAAAGVNPVMSAGATQAQDLLNLERRLRQCRDRKLRAYLELASAVSGELTWMQALEIFASTLPFHVNYSMVCEHVLGLHRSAGPSTTNTEHNQGLRSDNLSSAT